MATIQKLLVELGANSQSLVAELTKGRKNLRKFAKDAVDTGKKVSLAIAGASTAVAVGVVAMIEQQSAKLDLLAKKADKLGLGTAALQKLEYQAELTGVSQDTLGTALQRMTRRVAEAAKGSGEAKNAIAELGLSAQVLAGMSPDQQFYAIANAMKGVSTQGDRVRLAMRIFDTEGVGLVNTFAANLEDLGKEFDELGVAITRPQAAAVEAYNDAKTRIGTIMEGLKNQITVGSVPALEVLINKTLEFIKEAGGIEQVAQNMTTWVLTGIQKMVQGMQTLIEMINEVKLAYNTIVGTGQVAGGIISKGVASVAGSTPLSMLPGMDKLAENADMLGDSFYSVANDTAAARVEMLRNAQQYNDRMQSLVDSVGEARQAVISGFNGGEAAAKREADIAQWRSEIAALQQQIMDSPGQNVVPVLEQIQALKDKIANSNEPIIGSNDKNTEATNRNTAAMLALAGKSGETAAQKAGVTQERMSTTKGGKTSEAFEELIRRTRTIIGTSQAHASDASVFKNAAMAMIARAEGMGGFDTDKMRQQMQELLSRMGSDVGQAVQTAMTGADAAQGKSMGSITITVKKEDGGEVSGTVTGEQAFLQQLANIMSNVSTAV